MKSDYVPEKAKVLEKEREGSDTVRIRTDFRIDHLPGQFVQIGLPGIGEAPISISSFSDKYVEMHVREVGNVTNALGKIKKGDHVWIRGPYGNSFPVDLLGKTGLIFVGGGCGAAPLSSVMDYIEKKLPVFRDVEIFFGFRKPEDMLLKEKIERWKRKGFQVNLSVDENPSGMHFGGRTGFVTNLLKEHCIEDKERAVLMCGPPIMMRKSVGILKSKGFRDDQFYLSTERLMQCGLGLCGHCMIHGKYTCLDGPIFRYDQLDVTEAE